MTTIAYRAGVLAADTGVAIGGGRGAHAVKIFRRDDGALAGAAGYSTYGAAFRKWFMDGCNGAPPEAKKDEVVLDRGVIFWPDGRIEVFEPGGSFSITAPYFAFGSGRPEALGAMFAGADARTAIAAAIAHDNDTSGDITVLAHEAEALGMNQIQQAAE